MSDEAERMEFSHRDHQHQRGSYPTVNVGVSPGQGSKEPFNIGLGKYKEAMHRLLENEDLQRVASYHNCECSNPVLFSFLLLMLVNGRHATPMVPRHV